MWRLNSKPVTQNCSLGTSCELALSWISGNLINERSILVQIQQAIIWTNDDPDLCRDMASLVFNTLIPYFSLNCFEKIIYTCIYIFAFSTILANWDCVDIWNPSLLKTMTWQRKEVCHYQLWNWPGYPWIFRPYHQEVKERRERPRNLTGLCVFKANTFFSKLEIANVSWVT